MVFPQEAFEAVNELIDAKEKEIEACCRCRFWQSQEGTPDGICRRYPPVAGDLAEVRRTDWCGEFRPKEAV